MTDIILNNLPLWTSAVKHKSAAGRGSRSKLELTGIKKLRELILELAVRGQLVPQDANDEPASELLKRIAEEKAELVKAGKLKKQKPLPEITKEEKPFALPQGWEWVRFGSLIDSIVSGGTPSKVRSEYWGGDIPWASVKDLGKSKYIAKTEDYITQEGLDKGSKLVDAGDILICTRMGLGKIAIAEVPLAINQDLKGVKLSSHIDIDFFFLNYKTLKIEGTGTTVAGITQDQLLSYVIALPAYSEQKRIVDKVDELMALCDQLEQQTENHTGAHQQLVETLLATLTNTQSADELNANWARLAAHFDLLFAGPMGSWAVDRLKDAILQLAVQGKLVPQNPADEPASVLLARIEAEKAELIKQGKLKKQKTLPTITDDEKPFGLPQGWEWAQTYQLSTLITDGTHHTPQYTESGIPFLSVKDMSSGRLSFEDTRFISENEHSELIKRCHPEKGDLLLTKVGTTGVPVIVDTDRPFSIFVSVALIKLIKGTISLKYLKYVFESSLLKKQAEEGTEGIGNKNLVLRKIAVFCIPVAPIEEQTRIVEKVDQLFALCDQLKAALDAACDTQLQLSSAVVEQSLACH